MLSITDNGLKHYMQSKVFANPNVISNKEV